MSVTNPRASNNRPTVSLVKDKVAQAQALRLRLRGKTYRAIAEAQGCNVKTAYTRVQKAIHDLVPAEDRELARTIELDRLDRITETGMTLMRSLAAAGNVEGWAKAAEKVLATSDRRGRLIGLDAPVKIDTTFRSAVDVQIEQLTEKLARNAGEPVLPG